MRQNSNISNFRNTIRKHHLLEKYHLKSIGVFGSYARGESANDIDILIEDSDDYSNLIQFQTELEELLHKDVDIVIEKFANPIVLHRAKKDLVYVTQYKE